MPAPTTRHPIVTALQLGLLEAKNLVRSSEVRKLWASNREDLLLVGKRLPIDETKTSVPLSIGYVSTAIRQITISTSAIGASHQPKNR